MKPCGYVAPRVEHPDGSVTLASNGGCLRAENHGGDHCWATCLCDYEEHNDAEIPVCELGHRWCGGHSTSTRSFFEALFEAFGGQQ